MNTSSAADSKLASAPFTEPRIPVVLHTALCAGADDLRRCLTEPLREIAFDLFTIPGAGVELAYQPRRPGTKTARHLVPVRLGHLPHGAIELEFLDRPEHQHLLALERGPRPLPN